MSARGFILLLVIAWAGVFAASIFLAQAVEGPRNVDTGFRRLDTLLLWQGIAFGIAVVSAAVTWAARSATGAIKWVGYAPLAFTLLLIAAGIAGAVFMNYTQPESVPAGPTAPVTAPAEPAAPTTDAN